MIRQLAAWWQRHRPFRSGGIVPAPPQPKPINAILRGGPGHNRRIKNVVGDKILIPVPGTISLQWPGPWDVHPGSEPPIGEATYHRTRQTLKDGTVVFRQSHPVKVVFTLKVGGSPALWYSTQRASEMVVALEEKIAKHRYLNMNPPGAVTIELEGALSRMIHSSIADPEHPPRYISAMGIRYRIYEEDLAKVDYTTRRTRP